VKAGVFVNIMMMLRKPDFIAQLKYFSAFEGGRTTSAVSGYRPIIKFQDLHMRTSGQQVFVGREFVKPGEIAKAEITIASIEPFQNSLYVGQSFEFSEGINPIGVGTIIEILNKNLEKKRD
jgi:translation elongation factor EF-Tu-like GTPase